MGLWPPQIWCSLVNPRLRITGLLGATTIAQLWIVQFRWSLVHGCIIGAQWLWNCWLCKLLHHEPRERLRDIRQLQVAIDYTTVSNKYGLTRWIYVVGNGRSTVASAILDVGETTSFDVCYHASLARKSQGQIRLSVVDNEYEDCVVHLVAEAYQDDISIDNVASVTELTEDIDEVTVVDGDVTGM